MAKLDAMFDALLKKSGSDLHLAVGYPPMIRQHGNLTPLLGQPLDDAEVSALIFEVLSDSQKARLEKNREVDFAYSCGERARFRGNCYFKLGGLGAVFRVVPSELKTLEDLGCPAIIGQLASRRQGLVLVTGPTGSGKTTTLAALVDRINRSRPCHILTIEDPIEFVHRPIRAHITQREIGAHAPSFAAAVRSAARDDVDVVLIGELRETATMRQALALASSGVLVLGTLHTNTAASTVERILGSFPAAEQPQMRSMLADCLGAVVAQQLLRTADGKGRVAAHEVLLGTSGVAALIREGKTHQLANAIQGGKQLGMQTMDTALERLLTAKEIDLEAAIERAHDKDFLMRLAERLDPNWDS